MVIFICLIWTLSKYSHRHLVRKRREICHHFLTVYKAIARSKHEHSSIFTGTSSPLNLIVNYCQVSLTVMMLHWKVWRSIWNSHLDICFRWQRHLHPFRDQWKMSFQHTLRGKKVRKLRISTEVTSTKVRKTTYSVSHAPSSCKIEGYFTQSIKI